MEIIYSQNEMLTAHPSSASERGRRVKILRVLANLDRKSVEEKYNINFNTLKGWELARHGGLTEKGAKKILAMCHAEGVNCDLQWLLHGIGAGPTLYNKITYAASDTDPEKKILNEILFFRQQHENAIDYLVNDDSMTPFYLPNDYVCGIKREGKEIEKVIGLPCIVELAAGGILLRKVMQSCTPNHYQLQCINSQFEPFIQETELISASPVIWHRRKDVE